MITDFQLPTVDRAKPNATAEIPPRLSFGNPQSPIGNSSATPAEAEPLLVPACELFKQQDAAGTLTDLPRVQVQNRVRSLVQLYEATGRPEKAAEWKKWAPRSNATVVAPARPATPTPATPAPAAAPKP